MSENRFEGTQVAQWAGLADNPAAPEGLQQAAQAAEGVATADPRFAQSKVGQWAGESGFVANANAWYTGQNREGVNNGWDNDWVDRFIKGQDEAAEQGTLGSYFSDPKATGVVTWDHENDEGTKFKFGDIYDNGKLVGNVFKDNDRDTANLLMAPWLFDGTQQARIFADSDRMNKLNREVESKREENNVNIPKALTARELMEKTEAREESFTEGEIVGGWGVDEGVVLGSAAGGAAIGGGFGTIVPGVGNVVGATGGAIIGGLAGLAGGYLNKDELTEQAARAYEITALANRENGMDAALTTGLQQWSGYSMNLTSPVTNLVHGAADLTKGDIGDMDSAFYETDKMGRSKRGIGWQVLGLGAATTDGIMQFANPFSRTIYTAQMGGHILGEVGNLAVTRGESFNPRSGQFENIFFDDDGNVDPVSGAAGILKIGVDAVQLGGLRGLARQTTRNQRAFNDNEMLDLASYRFSRGADGEVVMKRDWLAMLAPSEQVAAISVSRKARIAALSEGRAVSADDFYQAAYNLSTGGNRLKVAMVNGFGEGYEELAQGVLEPISMDGALDYKELVTAFMYGAASGVGMSLGATAGAIGRDAKMRARADTNYAARYDTEAMPDEMWNQLSDSEKRIWATQSKADAMRTKGALERLARESMDELVANSEDAAAATDAKRTFFETEMKNASIQVNQYTKISGIVSAGLVSNTGANREGTVRAEAAIGSGLKVMSMLTDRARGLPFVEQTLNNEIARTDISEADRQELEARLESNRRMQQVAPHILERANDLAREVYEDPANLEAHVIELNRFLEKAFAGRAQFTPEILAETGLTLQQAQLAAAQYVTHFQSREPKLDTGSYLGLLPQASPVLTANGSDNFLQINMDVLSSINGDFDGDQLRPENQVVLSDERFMAMRAGQFFGGHGDTIDIATRNFEGSLTRAVAEGLVAETGSSMRQAADATMGSITHAISLRYGHMMSADVLSSILGDFRTLVLAGDPDARTSLISALAREAGGQITELGRQELNNEWLWIGKVVQANFQEFQRSFRIMRAQLNGVGPTTPEQVSSEYPNQGTNHRKSHASTPAQTLAVWAEGNVLFRKFQKIHYAAQSSKANRAGTVEYSDLQELIAYYAMISRNVTQSELAIVSTGDQVADRVLVMLARVVEDAMETLGTSLDPTTAMTIVANMKVKNVFWAEDGWTTDGQDVSLVQMLLARALDAEEAEYDQVFRIDEKMRAKHARLRAMTVPNKVNGGINAERAFIEVFRATQFGESLSGATGALAPQTTPEQWLQAYRSADDRQKQQLEAFYTGVPEYLDRKESTNIPYSLKEMERKEISAYRSMLDAMLAVGRHELSFNPKAKKSSEYFTGELADPHNRAVEDLEAAHNQVRKALEIYRKALRERQAVIPEGAALVQQMFSEDSRFARQVLATIPQAQANAVFSYDGKTLYVKSWVYEMFTVEKASEAVMFYYRNLVNSQRRSIQMRMSEGKLFGSVRDKIDSRFMRLLYDLAEEPGQRNLERVLVAMAEAKDVNEFAKWLNTQPGIVRNQAPILPFNDDVGAFDPDVMGGWLQARSGSDLRSAIAAMKTGAEQFRRGLQEREAKKADDAATLASIIRARTDAADATDADRENLRKFTSVVNNAKRMRRVFGPNAVASLVQGAAAGVDAQSTDKGRAPTSFEAIGQFQMLMDAFGFLPGRERALEDLTAHGLQSLRQNIQDVGRTRGQSMDAYGRTISWETLTVDSALEMLSDPEAKDLAVAMLTPSALELGQGMLSEKTMVQASLSTLVSGSSYQDLFKTNSSGDLSFGRALNYLITLDSMARNHGGSLDIPKALCDRVIVMTSALKRPARAYDYQRLFEQAVMNMARELQIVGQAMSSPDARKSNSLKAMRNHAVKTLRKQANNRRARGFVDTAGDVVKVGIDSAVQNLEIEREEVIESMMARNLSPAETQKQFDKIWQEYEANIELINSVLDDDHLLGLLNRFQVIGDDEFDAQARVQIIEFATGFTSFKRRAPEVADIFTKVARQRAVGQQVELTHEEWGALSRSVMGVALADKMNAVASHVPIPPFMKGDPDETQARFYKYFDPAHSWIALDILDEASPLAKAAGELHVLANRPTSPIDLDEAKFALNRGMLDPSTLGTWTPGLMSHITEARQRIDSASAPPGIAANGNGQKRWWAVGSATKRTDKSDGLDQLLSTAQFSGSMLDIGQDIYNEFPIQITGAPTPQRMPLAMLNNRFMKSLRLNGVDVPLSQGFRYQNDTAGTGLRYVALPRLRTMLQRAAALQGVDLSTSDIEIEFLHPDSQPPGPEWYNNVYFEGMLNSLLPDESESLINGAWADNGGEITTGTQRLLDAGKKGVPAVRPYTPPPADAMLDARELWTQSNDYAAMLRAKTKLWMQDDQGDGPWAPENYNAAYKTMKLLHLVVGMAEGKRVELTSEDVLAFQLANGTQAPLAVGGVELTDVKLKTLSPEVLRTMMGDVGTQSVNRFLADPQQVNALVPAYTGIDDRMRHLFADGWHDQDGGIKDTDLAHVGFQRTIKISTMQTNEERSARERRIEVTSSRRDEAHGRRNQKLSGKKMKESFANAVLLAQGLIDAERTGLDFTGLTGGMIMPRDFKDVALSTNLLDAYNNATTNESFERGWEVVDNNTDKPLSGRISIKQLGDKKTAPENWVVQDDLAVVNIGTFEGPERTYEVVMNRLETALRYLVDTGATIVLASGTGRTDARHDASTWLEAHGYVPVVGSKHMFRPVEFDSEAYQNERAYQSTLLETERLTPALNNVIFVAESSDDIGTDEGAAIRDPRTTKLKDRVTAAGMLPSSQYVNYNIPIDDGSRLGFYSNALAHLKRNLDPSNTEAREELLKMAGEDTPTGKPIDQALDDFWNKLNTRSSLMPVPGDEIEIGDIIPFLHYDGRVVLYRHGFKPPKFKDLDKLHAINGMNIALAKSERDANLTANSGTIVMEQARSGFGRRIVLEIPMQQDGDKIQLDESGLKVTLVPVADYFQPLEIPLFTNGTRPDLYTDALSVGAKEAYKGSVDNYRNALGFFQYDFLSDVTELFFPGGGSDPTNRTLTYTFLRKLGRQREAKIPLVDASKLSRMHVAASMMLAQSQAIMGMAPGSADWTNQMAYDDSSPSALIARAVIMYMLTPGANIDNVLASEGFSHPNAANFETTTRVPPGIFADLLNQGMDSPLHTELIGRFNTQLNAAADGSGYVLHPDWTLEITAPDGTKTRGTLMFTAAISSGDNPVLDGQSYDPAERAGVSTHNALATAMSTGGLTAFDKKAQDKSNWFSRTFTREGQKAAGGDEANLWTLYSTLPDHKDGTMVGYRAETRLETERRARAHDEIVGLYKPLDSTAWTDDEKLLYGEQVQKILYKLGLEQAQAGMVDTWVRQLLGRPHGIGDDGNPRGVIIGKDAIEKAKDIWWSISNDLVPTASGNIPLMDVNHLTLIYVANSTRDPDERWAPRMSTEKGARKATTWDDWVNHAFSVMLDKKIQPKFDTVYALAVDGLMHGYQGATSATRYLPVAMDRLRQNALMDPKNERLMVSLFADENLLATDPVLFNTKRASLDDILTGQRIYENTRGEYDAASAMGRQEARLARWRKEVDATRATSSDITSLREPGIQFIEESTKTSALFRSLINLRAGNTFFNIPLIVSAPIEAFRARSINSMANAAVLEGTGWMGRAGTRFAEMFKDTSLGAVARELGYEPLYTMEEQNQLKELKYALSTRDEFKAMIYGQLMYHYPSIPGIGKVEKVLERYAKLGGRLQDPAWGMLPRDLSTVYLETVLRKMSQDPLGENIYSVDTLIKKLSRDPEWVMKNDPEAHMMAIAAISDIRSLKPNVLSLALRGILEPMSQHPSFAVNAAGNTLKMLTLFQNFWTNYAINMTGLQGPANMVAFMVDGREKKFMRRLQHMAAGIPYETGDTEYIDMTETLESLDLADAFIRGGITHTALFSFGILAGGLGLSGEDEEEKFRRRQAELQGAGFVHDPRKLQNDFANRDSLFLDNIPFLGTYFRVPDGEGGSRSIAHMHWIVRSIVSPIVGMERFYNTGDFGEVVAGFQDAFGSHPIVNTQLWNAGIETVAELQGQAAAEAEVGGPENMAASAHFLTTAVGILDRMLLENQMVNMIYTGADRYDRNPYVLPELDSDQNPQGDIRGNPTPNDALRQFVDDEGNIGEGYVKRDYTGAQYRMLSENRFGLALLGSLYSGVTGGGFTGSDFFRQNMVPKIRQVELQPRDEDVTRADILDAFAVAGGAPSLTMEEAEKILRQKYIDAGIYYDPEKLEAQAKQWSSQEGPAMSELTAEGREVLKKDGAAAVIRGLFDKTVSPDDASLNGVFITKQQRDEIFKDWSERLMREGIELGLSQSQAGNRMERIMYGPFEEPTATGLYDVIYSDKIPWADTLEYNQLNTTYVTGPDGYPRATGFTREGLLSAILPIPFGALQRAWVSEDTGLGMDARMNTVDGPAGINTGMRALERRGEDWVVPSTEDEIRAAAQKITDAIKDIQFPMEPFPDKKSGSGWQNFGGYRRRSYGGGGGGYRSSYKPSSYVDFQRMYALPDLRIPYGISIPFINTSNPIVRRSDVRRERVWSERGRLKQWQ